MKFNALARSLAVSLAALSLTLSGLVASPGFAGDDKGLGTPTPTPSTGAPGASLAASADPWVNREHSTSNHERVDLRNDRISKVQTQHGVNFTALVRVVSWARSPRMDTSPDGIDRGIYRYRIYEYVESGGDLVRTGRWCVLQTIIEWGDGHANRGWMVTTYPVSTNTGSVRQVNGKSYVPAWLVDEAVMGPVNNDILY